MTLVDPQPRPIASLGAIGPIAYGQWRFTPTNVSAELRAVQSVLETALDAGMNLVDTADVYGLDWGGQGFGEVEALLGSVLAQAPHLRERMVLATKGGIRPPVPYDSSPQWLRTACEDSLRRLNTDVIDLYQIHRPDLFTHPASVAETLASLRESGKIREVGVSNYTPEQTAALQAFLPFPIATTQPEFSAAQLDPIRDGTFDRAMEFGTVPLVWSPLAGGRLATGEGISPELLSVLDALAAREGVERWQIALAFALAHPSKPVAIVGTQRTDRLLAASAALTITLDRRDVYSIVQASEGRPLP